jgi:hypothetical protein
VVINFGTVDELIRTVKDIVDVVNQTDTSSPVPDLIGPVQVSVVASVSSESRRDLEEATVGN